MELGAVVQTALRTSASDARAGAERIALSSRLLMPLLAGQGSHVGMAELARDLRAEIAVRGERTLTLVLPAGAASDAQPARIDLGGRQVPIPADLRDTLLARLGAAESTSGPARAAFAPEESAGRAWATGATAQAAVQTATQPAGAVAAFQPAQSAAQSALAASVSGIARELVRSLQPGSAAASRDSLDVPRVAVGGTLGDPMVATPVGPVLPVSEVASRLRRELERSGLFFESHLAQWARGERSVEEMRAELLHLASNSSASSARQAIADGSPQRVAGQLRLLQEPCIAISGAAWPGQPLQMLIEREATPRDAAPGLPPVFGAHLRLMLPQLGSVEVHLRLSGDAVATTICAQQPDRLQAAVPVLSEQLCAAGLKPVVTHVLPAEAVPA